MIDRERFAAKCAAAGFSLTAEQLSRLERYAALLVETNEHVNLTRILTPEGIEDKHFLDSLSLLSLESVRGAKTLADVGSGAGFPGLVLKIARPKLAVTLLEPTGKRCEFLRRAAAELGLDGLEVAKERAEEAARKRWREQFDVVTARAVAALPVLAEYCLPLARVGGAFCAMKGPGGEEEAAAAAAAIQKLGGGKALFGRFTLPDGDERCLIEIPKARPTPPQYPRQGGRIAKSPL